MVEDSRDALLKEIKNLRRQVSDLTKENQNIFIENKRLKAIVEHETVLRELAPYAVLQAQRLVDQETIKRQDKEIAFLERIVGKKYGGG
jgi:regulator of replication initiation timing